MIYMHICTSWFYSNRSARVIVMKIWEFMYLLEIMGMVKSENQTRFIICT